MMRRKKECKSRVHSFSQGTKIKQIIKRGNNKSRVRYTAHGKCKSKEINFNKFTINDT